MYGSPQSRLKLCFDRAVLDLQELMLHGLIKLISRPRPSDICENILDDNDYLKSVTLDHELVITTDNRVPTQVLKG